MDAEPETAPRGSVSSWPRSIANADGRPSLFSAFLSAGQQPRAVRLSVSADMIMGGTSKEGGPGSSWLPELGLNHYIEALPPLLGPVMSCTPKEYRAAMTLEARTPLSCRCSIGEGRQEILPHAHMLCRRRQRSRQPPSRGFPASRQKPWSSEQPQLPCHQPPHGPGQSGMGPRSGQHCCRRSLLQGRGLSRAAARSWARTGCPACPRLPSGWPSSSAL